MAIKVQGTNVIDDSRQLSVTGVNTIGSVKISSGIVTATSGIITYYGDGQYLTNVVSGVGIQSGGTVIGTGFTTLNFIGTGNTFAANGTTIDISISSGGGGGADSDWVETSAGIHTLTSVGIGTTNPLYDLHVNGDFLVSAGTAASNHIVQKAYELNNGSISWEGTAGQLFSISNNLTSGSLFNVSNTSGIPYFDVDADGTIQLSPYDTGNVSIGVTQSTTNFYVSGNSASNVIGLGTVTTNTALDFTAGNNFSMIVGASIVLSNPTGMTTGQSGIIQIQQDGTGSRTVGFSSYWDFPGASVPSLSTGANALDTITYFVRSSTSIIANAIIGIGTL